MALILFWALGPGAELLRGFANLWGLGLVLAAAATLVWFAYSICLRRLLRVRKIAYISGCGGCLPKRIARDPRVACRASRQACAV